MGRGSCGLADSAGSDTHPPRGRRGVPRLGNLDAHRSPHPGSAFLEDSLRTAGGISGDSGQLVCRWREGPAANRSPPCDSWWGHGLDSAVQSTLFSESAQVPRHRRFARLCSVASDLPARLPRPVLRLRFRAFRIRTNLASDLAGGPIDGVPPPQDLHRFALDPDSLPDAAGTAGRVVRWVVAAVSLRDHRTTLPGPLAHSVVVRSQRGRQTVPHRRSGRRDGRAHDCLDRRAWLDLQPGPWPESSARLPV